jgi:hypothetical protein
MLGAKSGKPMQLAGHGNRAVTSNLHREEGRKMATIPKMAERQEAVRLFEAYKAAERAYAQYPHKLKLVWEDDENGIEHQVAVRCDKSGVALLRGDEVVDDPSTGETFLRCELGLPPRALEEDAEEPEKAEAA